MLKVKNKMDTDAITALVFVLLQTIEITLAVKWTSEYYKQKQKREQERKQKQEQKA